MKTRRIDLVVLVAIMAVILAGAGCRMTYYSCKVSPEIKMPEAYAKAGNQQVTIATVIYSDSDARLEADKSVPIDVARGLGQGSAVSAAPNATAAQSGTVTAPNETKATAGKK